MSRKLERHLTLAGLLSALTLLAVLALAGSASAAARTVTFDDVVPDTRVSTEYESSHGLTFPDDPGKCPGGEKESDQDRNDHESPAVAQTPKSVAPCASPFSKVHARLHSCVLDRGGHDNLEAIYGSRPSFLSRTRPPAHPYR